MDSGAGSDQHFNKYVHVPVLDTDVENPFGAVPFDPDPNNLPVLQVSAQSGLRTGDEVVYHTNTGDPIGGPSGGLTDGTTYYVIKLDDTHIQLADSRDHALAGKAIKIDDDDHTGDATLTEVTANVFAYATSGAGSGNVGVAGSVAINRGEVTTTARINNDVTLADGGDLGSGIGPISIRANTTTDNTANAIPEGDGGTAGSVGVGASFALNMVEHDTTAEVTDGSDLSGTSALNPAASFTVEAIGIHRTSTEARNGSKGTTSVGGAVAIAISEADTKAHVGTGVGVTSTGAVSVTSSHTNVLLTKVSSEAAGSSASVGASVGVNYVSDTNTAQLARDGISAAGAATLSA
jgi:hypothetical protein